MASLAVLLVMLVSSLLLCYNRVEGGRALSKDEELELERQLKLLNKPAVKTILTKYGDVYDCVDFYKQPAFDHPLLKNHTFHFQMRPTPVPKRMTNEGSSSKMVKIGLKRGCPIGTVPIRRTTKKDLIRAKLHAEICGSKFNPLTTERPGLYQAVVRTKNDPNMKYNGAGCSISLHRPVVEQSQYSSGQMKVQNGPDIIQVGWTVNPALYGDNQTRLFTFLQAGQTSCFNTQCPGFVIVNTDIPLDSVVDPTSTDDGRPYAKNFILSRDSTNGNWWYFVGTNLTEIGFWPARIFSGLAGPATYLDWGGEAFSPPGTRGPPMGSGKYPVLRDTRYEAFSDRITTINDNNARVDAEGIEEYTDDRMSYGVIDDGFIDKNIRRLAFWGGTGH